MLEFLKQDQKNIQWEQLLTLKKERDSWWNRESSKKFLGPITNLPIFTDQFVDTSEGIIKIGDKKNINEVEYQELLNRCQQLKPWKKGPFSLFDINIDAEWRSDMKWKRLEPFLPELKNKKILDIGCNNGYFMFKMANQDPKYILGIDPVLQIASQFKLLNHYANFSNLHFELFGVEHLEYFKNVFDVIFSMGIVYHHRNPIQQLIQIREALVPGGEAILETIGIPGDESHCLFPEDRYARMKNVWFVPTLSCFINWTKKARFIDISIIADTPLEYDEQRLTDWCPPPNQSLKDSLDPKDNSLTIEGLPAPRRFCIKVKKRKGN